MKKRFTLSVKSLMYRFGLLTTMMLIFSYVSAQTMTELVVPKYIGGKTAAAANNARTAFAVCVKFDGLTPNTLCDVKAAIELPTAVATNWGAGNYWNGTAFQSNPIIGAFTSDATGSSGPYWIIFQPTGNSSRFNPGQVHNIRVAAYPSGGAIPNPIIGTKTITCLDLATTAMTPEATDDGAYIKGSADPTITGKYVLLYDNTTGTGDPLFSYQVRQATATQVANTQLNAEINDIYMQAGTSAVGDYPAPVPIGANNPNGVRRVESRNADNTVFGYNTDTDGIWPSSATLGNTTNMARLDIRYITASDAPLTPAAGAPVVTTTAVTNITYNSATSGGNVTSIGGAPVTARGICWSTTVNPTVADPHTTEPGTTGSFTSNMTGLNYFTEYHVRAYATNSIGTSYGADLAFTTLAPPFAPVADFVASETIIVTGMTVDFTDLSTNVPTTWNWSFIGGSPATSNVQHPQDIQYNFSGLYNVCLTATNSYGTDTKCKDAYIQVNEPIDAEIVITEIMYNSPESGTDSLEFIELYNNGTEALNMENYSFSLGVVFTFPALTINPGEYQLVAVNSNAIQNTFGKPSLQWTTGALSNSGEPIVLVDNFGFLVDSVNFDDILPWDTLADGWGPSLTLCNPSLDNTIPENWVHSSEFVALNAEGDSIFATPAGGCLIPIPPVADFTANPLQVYPGDAVQFTDQSSGGIITSWSWTFEGGSPATSTDQNPLVTYPAVGTYDVQLTVTNIDGTDTKIKTDYISVVINPGIGELNASQYKIYPNPTTTGFMNIEVPGGTNEIKIYSIVGNMVYSSELTARKSRIDLTELQKGVFFVKFVKDGETQVTRKLVIQ